MLAQLHVRPAMKKPPAASSYARLTSLAKGRIIGMREAGMDGKRIADQVHKTDGVAPSLRTIDRLYARFLEDPGMDL